MLTQTRRVRPAALAAFVAIASLLSCGREITGPGARGRVGEVSLNLVFGDIRLAGTGEVMSIGSVVDFSRVRVVLLRQNGDTAVDRVIAFPPDSAAVRLAITVTLGEDATSDREVFAATLKYINATGDTVFTGGPSPVTAILPGGTPVPDQPIVILYTGRGANAASLTIAPPAFTGTINQQVTFSALVQDATQTTIADVPVAYTSTDSARVRVNLRTGVATLLGARGSALVIAQTLTGQADSAPVSITPTASAIALVSGGNQQVRQGEPFPQPVRVRVTAVDNIGVAGVGVLFEATRGQGSPSPATVLTDANGFAETVWTAGDSAGVATLRASVVGRPVDLTVSGTQLSSAPTSVAFTAQPANFTAGDTIPPFNVLVLDATGDTVSGFSGNVSLDLNGGAAGALLLGNVVVAANNGIAAFSGLTINRGGTGFRLRATVAGVPPVLTNTFNVTAAPPTAITPFGGANQTAPASTVLPDSVRVRVTNTFGAGVGGVTVNWAIAVGGGSVTPATSVTDSVGRAAVQWTLGAAGTQQITAGVTGLQPVPISATIFVPQGQPTLFIAPEFISTTPLGVRAVPIFITPAPGAQIVATLEMRDTSIARWTVDSTVFTAGTSLRSPTLVGRAAGSTWAVATSPVGTDSLLVTVDSAFVLMSGNLYSYVVAGDTLRKVVYLSEPAPPGGIIVTVVSSDTSIIRVAPGTGRGSPADECDYYCTGLRAADEPFRLLAPPSDTAFVNIPAGQLAGQVVLLTSDNDGQSASVTFSAPGHASGSADFTVSAQVLSLYPVYSAFGVPIAVGHRNAIRGYFTQSMTREIVVRVTSRNPAVVRVDSLATVPRLDSYTGEIWYDVLAADSTWIVLEGDGFRSDSIFVRGTAPVVNIDVDFVSTQIGARTTVNLFSSGDSFLVNGYYYAMPTRATDLPLTLTSSDPSVFVPDFSSVVLRRGEPVVPSTIRAVGIGTAWLHLTSPGTAPDSIPVTVSGNTFTVYDSYFRVGAGQVHNDMYAYVPNGSNGTGQPIAFTLTSSDPAILTVLTPQVLILPGGYSEQISVLGRAPGAVTLTFAAPGLDTVTYGFTVTSPALALNSFPSGGTVDPDSSGYSPYTQTTDSLSVARAPGDTVYATLRSTDPAVLLVTDSLIRINPGSGGSSFQGTFRPIAPGTARLTVSAAGHRPDTSGLVTVRPMRLEAPTVTLTVGRGTESSFTLYRRAPSGRTSPFTVTATGPAGVTVAAPVDTFPAGTAYRTIMVRSSFAAGTGIDTLVFASPGFQSDTLLLNVIGSRATPLLSSNGLIGQDLEVSAAVRAIGTFNYAAPADSTTLIVQAIDTAMISVIDDTIRIAASESTPYQLGLIRFRRPGAGQIRLIDPTGRFAPDSVTVYGYAQQLYGSQNKIFLTMGQSDQGDGTYYIYRDYASADSVWVNFTSSAPGLVPAPDSILMQSWENYVYFDLAAGDSVGGARITATARGYLAQEFDVFVTRGLARLYVSNLTLGVGSRASVEAYIANSVTWDVTPLSTPLQLRLRSTDPSIATIGADSLFVVPAGTYYLDSVGPVIATGLGRADIVVADPRDGLFQQLLPSRQPVEVLPARLSTNARVLSATVGLSTYQYANFVRPAAGADSVWIQLRSVGGKLAFNADSVLAEPTGASNGYFVMTGLSVGLDTIVFTAPGYPTDTVIVNITLGRLLQSGTIPSTLAVDDSVLILLYFRSADGEYMALGEASREMTLAVTGGLQTLDALTGTPIATVTAVNGANSIAFWVKATGSGGGELTVSGPGLLPFRRVFDTIVRP